MKKVWIEPGCISCGACEFIAPEVFEVTDISRVRSDVDIEVHKTNITAAVIGCPVQVIQTED
ncbi:MAG TPA: ferredoxin [Candidatus Babeliaceae bacterium]|nr:ferredoxin [Candidatus Babeliaceae bacterium]